MKWDKAGSWMAGWSDTCFCLPAIADLPALPPTHCNTAADWPVIVSDPTISLCMIGSLATCGTLQYTVARLGYKQTGCVQGHADMVDGRGHGASKLTDAKQAGKAWQTLGSPTTCGAIDWIVCVREAVKTLAALVARNRPLRPRGITTVPTTMCYSTLYRSRAPLLQVPKLER